MSEFSTRVDSFADVGSRSLFDDVGRRWFCRAVRVWIAVVEDCTVGTVVDVVECDLEDVVECCGDADIPAYVGVWGRTDVAVVELGGLEDLDGGGVRRFGDGMSWMMVVPMPEFGMVAVLALALVCSDYGLFG